MILGIVVAFVSPSTAVVCGFLGTLFVSALKAVAPVLVFVLVGAAIANQQIDGRTQMRPIIVLYLVGTFAAAATAVIVSFIWPVTIEFAEASQDVATPGDIVEVLRNLLVSVVDNPVHATTRPAGVPGDASSEIKGKESQT